MAAFRASSLDAAPVTTTVTSLVAPSPPRTIPSASSRHTEVSPSRNAPYDASSTTAPDVPFASSMTQSFVEHSPSTVIALNVSLTASRSARSSSPFGTAASVVTKPSIVAIIGSIIPEPFAIPPIAASRPPSVTRAAASFGNGSVVMIARAACAP